MNPKPVSIWKRQFYPQVSLFRFVRWLVSWRMIKRYLFCLACLATLVAIFYAEENWRGRHNWKKFQRTWEAKGEVFDWRAFVPPPVPDDQNFAQTPFWAEALYEWDINKQGIRLDTDTNLIYGFTRLHLSAYRTGGGVPEAPPASSWAENIKADLKAWQAYYRAPGKTNNYTPTNQFPIPPTPGNPAADVLLALGKYDDVLNLLRSASQRPFSRFPINYGGGAGALLPHLARIVASMQYLRARIVAELDLGRSQEAAQDVDLMFYLCDSVRSEPFEISQLVRAKVLDLELSAIWDGLTDHKWAPDQLRAIQTRLESNNFLTDFQRALKAEAALVSPTIDEFASSRLTAYAKIFAGQTTPKPLARYVRLAPRGWFEQEMALFARLQLEAAAAMDPPAQRVDLKKLAALEPDFQAFQNRAVLLKYVSHWLSEIEDETKFNSGINSSVVAIMIRHAVRAQSSVNLAIVACALERSWLANKTYPEKLDDLVPRFLAKLPREIVSGDPLKYRRADDGRFVLYSTGLDGKDSGGIYRAPDGKLTGNWVWRYPSK